MIFTDKQLDDLLELAITAAYAAGQVINTHRQDELLVEHKATGTSAASQVVTEVDRKAEAAILEILSPSCAQYDLALLSEESPDTGLRQEKHAFWCVDPMDGTLAFINGVHGYSVSIALVARDGTPLIGVVYDPVNDQLYQAVKGRGALKEGLSIQISALEPDQPLILVTDNSFREHPWLEQTEAGLKKIAGELGVNGAEIQFSIGAVMNACAVLERANSCYFKFPRSGNSGGSLWDYGATATLFNEAKGVACDIYGGPLDLNRVGSTFMNHKGLLYTGHGSLAESVISLNHTLQQQNS